MRRTDLAKTKRTKNASKLRVGIVVSDYNVDITGNLLAGALETLREWGVSEKNCSVVHVPGAFEIPFGCSKLLMNNKKPHAIIALGCVLKGETKHDEYISNAVAHGITQLSIQYKIPISFGVLTPNTLEQARERSQGDTNKGKEAAVAALELATLVI
jgi:6,7-dimethyl-8-ribityllumazine synthase